MKSDSNDDDFMRRCLELGHIALANGEAPVGSLIVVGGRIIAEGVEAVKHKNDPTAHAEIEAIRLACSRLNTLDLSGATLYTNVEPCVMCAYAIRQTGVGCVVFGARNEEEGGSSSRFAVLTDASFPASSAPPVIREGVLREECEAVLRRFQETSR